MEELNQQLQVCLTEKNYSLAAQILLSSPDLLQSCMQHFFTSDWKFSQPLSNVFEVFKNGNQSILLPYFSEWIEQLKTPSTNAFQRNSYRYFQDVDIPEKHQGTLYDLAFQDMMNHKSPIAVKAFAMTTCYNIAKHYPELLPELKEAIQIVSNSESPAVKGRSKQLLKKIEKL